MSSNIKLDLNKKNQENVLKNFIFFNFYQKNIIQLFNILNIKFLFYYKPKYKSNLCRKNNFKNINLILSTYLLKGNIL